MPNGKSITQSEPIIKLFQKLAEGYEMQAQVQLNVVFPRVCYATSTACNDFSADFVAVLYDAAPRVFMMFVISQAH